MSLNIAALCGRGYQYKSVANRQTFDLMFNYMLRDVMNHPVGQTKQKMIDVFTFLSVNTQYLDGDYEKNILQMFKENIRLMTNKNSYPSVFESYERLFGEKLPQDNL